MIILIAGERVKRNAKIPEFSLRPGRRAKSGDVKDFSWVASPSV
jgi:hypothetical protein